MQLAGRRDNYTGYREDAAAIPVFTGFEEKFTSVRALLHLT
jgi:hypothetical protein